MFLGSSVGIAKIITAHLNGQNGKENGVGQKEYYGITKEYNRIAKEEISNTENGEFSGPNQNGRILNQNGGNCGHQDGGNFTKNKGMIIHFKTNIWRKCIISTESFVILVILFPLPIFGVWFQIPALQLDIVGLISLELLWF